MLGFASVGARLAEECGQYTDAYQFKNDRQGN